MGHELPGRDDPMLDPQVIVGADGGPADPTHSIGGSATITGMDKFFQVLLGGALVAFGVVLMLASVQAGTVLFFLVGLCAFAAGLALIMDPPDLDPDGTRSFEAAFIEWYGGGSQWTCSDAAGVGEGSFLGVAWAAILTCDDYVVANERHGIDAQHDDAEYRVACERFAASLRALVSWATMLDIPDTVVVTDEELDRLVHAADAIRLANRLAANGALTSDEQAAVRFAASLSSRLAVRSGIDLIRQQGPAPWTLSWRRSVEILAQGASLLAAN